MSGPAEARGLPAAQAAPEPVPAVSQPALATLLPDAALASVAATDAQAFAAIYRRYSESLYMFCIGMLRDPDAAADCVQDVFVIAATRLSQLREHDKLRSWLYAIARHEALRRLRARRREEPSPPEEIAEISGTVMDSPDLGSRGKIIRAVNELPEPARTIVAMRTEGLGFKEIAEILNLSTSSIRNHMLRARIILRQQLEEVDIS